MVCILINVLDTETLNKYMNSSLNYLSIIFPLVSLSELENALQYSIKKRFINPNIDLDNTYKKKKIEATLLQISEYILRNNPIITASGCLFKNHDDSVDPMAEMLESFLSQRGFYKNKMYEFPKGSALYNKYNLLQLLEKINANALRLAA